jgi:hypothetical protein
MRKFFKHQTQQQAKEEELNNTLYPAFSKAELRNAFRNLEFERTSYEQIHQSDVAKNASTFEGLTEIEVAGIKYREAEKKFNAMIEANIKALNGTAIEDAREPVFAIPDAVFTLMDEAIDARIREKKKD